MVVLGGSHYTVHSAIIHHPPPPPHHLRQKSSIVGMPSFSPHFTSCFLSFSSDHYVLLQSSLSISEIDWRNPRPPNPQTFKYLDVKQHCICMQCTDLFPWFPSWVVESIGVGLSVVCVFLISGFPLLPSAVPAIAFNCVTFSNLLPSRLQVLFSKMIITFLRA